jgi:hypothetical protein
MADKTEGKAALPKAVRGEHHSLFGLVTSCTMLIWTEEGGSEVYLDKQDVFVVFLVLYCDFLVVLCCT